MRQVQNSVFGAVAIFALSAGLLGCDRTIDVSETPPQRSKAVVEPSIGVAQDNSVAVGILHSLSGTMAISETSLKDVALMTIEQINAEGGVLGRQLRPVVMDPASSWPLFVQYAEELLVQEEAAVIFGCWTSVSRKAVLPVLEKQNGLLFYPVQYEGEESSRHVFYTGATPNQQAIPAVDYLMSAKGGSVKRWFLVGTDYVYPRTTNRIVRAYLRSQGVAKDDIAEEYVPFGSKRFAEIVGRAKSFGETKKTAIISTINGDSNAAFYAEIAAAEVRAEDLPVMAFSVGEEELRGMETEKLVGHLASWGYFMSLPGQANQDLIAKWKAYVSKRNLPDRSERTVNDPMVATYLGIQFWRQAVEQSGTFDPDAVRQAVAGQIYRGFGAGAELTMDAENHHMHRPVRIGRIRADGQFDIVYNHREAVRAQPWSPHLPETKARKADWTFPWLCGDCESLRRLQTGQDAVLQSLGTQVSEHE